MTKYAFRRDGAYEIRQMASVKFVAESALPRGRTERVVKEGRESFRGPPNRDVRGMS